MFGWTFLKRIRFLAVLAFVAFALVVARASIQSITIDEAATYLGFVATGLYRKAAANNHVLNSMLMGASTELLGTSHFTARIPAMLGAIVYLSGAFLFCTAIAETALLQSVVFSALAFNPFILDHLVAARGYSLALGFLMMAIALPVWALSRNMDAESKISITLACSVCCGLSISANFSFGIAAVLMMGAIYLLMLWSSGYRNAIRLAVVSVLPAAAILLFLCGETIVSWPRGEFIYGATSLKESLASLADGSVTRPFYKPLAEAGPYVLSMVFASGIVWAISVARTRDWRIYVMAVLLSAAGLTMGVHLWLYRVYGLLMPKDRTAAFMVPLVVCALGIVATCSARSRMGNLSRGVFLSSLTLVTLFFLSCLRVSYFKEWAWDAETEDGYKVVRCIGERTGMARVGAGWPFMLPLNFYRVAEKSRLTEIVDEKTNPEGVEVYVLDTLHNPGVIEKRGLRVVYRGRSTDMVVAVDPEAEAAVRASGCVQD